MFQNINVGGKNFLLSNDTLSKIPFIDSLIKFDQKEIIFVDMDPIIFNDIIDRLENNKIFTNNHEKYLNFLCIDKYLLKNNNLPTIIPNENFNLYDNNNEIIQLVSYQSAYGSNLNKLNRSDSMLYSRHKTSECIVPIYMSELLQKTDDIQKIKLNDKSYDFINYIALDFDIISKIFVCEKYIDYVLIDNIYKCTGSYLDMYNRIYENKHSVDIKLKNRFFIKIPYLHGTHSYMISGGHNISIKLKNIIEIKNVSLFLRCGLADSNLRYDITWTPTQHLCHLPKEITLTSSHSFITIPIETEYAIRDMVLYAKNLKRATLYYDNSIRWSYSGFMLNNIVPKDILGHPLDDGWYYWSFSNNSDLSTLYGYANLENINKAKLVLELEDHNLDDLTVKFFYHQVFVIEAKKNGDKKIIKNLYQDSLTFNTKTDPTFT